MIILSPQHLRPAGTWNLPEEFEFPNYFTMASASAQQILEGRGFEGLGAAEAPYGWTRRLGPRVGSGVRVIRRGVGDYGATWDEFASRLVVKD